MMTVDKDKGIGNHVLRYWPVYLFLGGMIMNYALNIASIKQLDYRVTKVEAEQESTKDVLIQMRLDVAVIKNNVEEIKKRVQ